MAWTIAEINAVIASLEDDPLLLSDATINKSHALKEAWSDPETRARMQAASKEALNRPDVKALCSASAKVACSRLDVRERKGLHSKKEVEYKGVVYSGVYEASEKTGVTVYYMKKDPSFKYLPKPTKEI